MEFQEVMDKFNSLEKKIKQTEEEKILELLREYIDIVGDEILEYFYCTANLEVFLIRLYAELKNKTEGQILEKILEKYNLKYTSTIHNATRHMLGHEIDYGISRIDPINFPGVYNIEKKDSNYIMHTKIGKIKIYNASEVFKNHKSARIFTLPLPNQCYARTYDFVKMNSDSSVAVLSYMPNPISGGYYHAYIEREDDIIDIAANAYYSSKEEAYKLLNGKILGRYTLEEIEEFYRPFKYEKFNERYKLKVLAAYKTFKLI